MAEVAAGLLTSPFVKIAVDKLGSAIGEQASLLWSFSGDLEDMKDTMEFISAALKDAERRSVTEESVRLWLKRLKNAAYDICDMLDDYEDDRDQATAKMPRMLSCLPITRTKISLANKMKNIRAELKKINEQFQSFCFTKNAGPTILEQHYNQRETTSDVIDEQIIGRDEDKKKIMNLLSARQNDDEAMILPIYGLGGMGKSTLAQLIYNDTHFTKKYDNRVWIYVSQDFNLDKIGKKIISQLPPIEQGQRNIDSLQAINRCLDGLLYGRKVLIVLDDLWQEEDYELNKLKDMLHVGRKGYMIDIIVTTRKEDIANKICTNGSFELIPLKHGMCWDIIKRYSRFEQKPFQEKLLPIGLEIAKKCGGVALAAQALGYMLQDKDLSEWSEVNNSDTWNEFAGREENSLCNTVLPSLKLSYECMLPRLRLCFAYCAIFPKGHDIVQNYLIHQWVALDFIEPSNKIGEKYINKLLGMSFLQHSKIPLDSKRHVVRYTMHDLVHDLARSIIGDELNVFSVAPKSNTQDQKYCRYALLKKYEQPSKLSDILPSKLRALHFSDSSNLDLLHGAFSFAKYLRILDFSECSSILLPTSIGQLKHLKCLISPRMQNDRFPECITNLPKLQYLNLNGSSLISALPESIGKLGCLKYLDLSGFSNLSELPESFGNLKRMVHLDMSHCSRIIELPGSLGNLTNLQHLDLSDCSSVKAIPESLSGLTQLQYLNLSCCRDVARLPEAIGSLVNLQYLNMSGCWNIRGLPESIKKLQNLLHLDLSGCLIDEDLSGALRSLTALQHLDLTDHRIYGLFASGDVPNVLGNLTNLKYLSLSDSVHFFYDRELYVDFISKLTNLEHLDLSGRRTLHLPESIGNLKRLHTLNLSYCTDMKSLPKSICEINLRSLLMDGCPEELVAQAHSLTHYSLTLPLFNVRVDDVSGRSNLPLLEGADVGELDIRYLERVRFLDEACRMKMLEKQNLSELSLMWTNCADRILEDKDLLEQLVPPRGLKKLSLKNYSSASFPSWFMGICQHLPNLVHINLSTVLTCSSLPPLGQLPNLKALWLSGLPGITKIDHHLCGGKGAFPRLLDFSIADMLGLEEWSTTYCVEDGVEKFMFPVLDKLSILRCQRLRLNPCPPTFRTCRIQKSDHVISSLEEVDNTSHRSSATSLELCFSDTFCQSSRLFHHFPALQDLTISNCSKLMSLPESVQSLSSLQSLDLRWSDNVSALPEWLSDLSSLRSLCIVGCSGIKCLPSCVQKLTKLKTLTIVDNKGLKRWCEVEQNKRKLAHINNIIYGGDAAGILNTQIWSGTDPICFFCAPPILV